MKKIILSALLLVATAASAQLNLQLHYDLGGPLNSKSESDRALFTTTVEMFQPDRLGSTFFFVDMDYRQKNRSSRGMMGAYWEIGRDFYFHKVENTNHSFTAHVEYDGGLGLNGPYQQAFLLGPAWSWHSNDFRRTLTFQALYKLHLKSNGLNTLAGFQTTLVWGLNFAHDWCTFSGYADYWYGHIANKFGQKGMIFMAEPQFWVNVMNKCDTKQKLAVGTEWEMSNNFVWRTGGKNTFFFNPTLAVKWTF